MAWLYLVAAGICEVAWAAGLKKYGFTRTWGGAFTVVVMLLSFVLLDRAMRSLPLGTAYVVWTGIGAVGSAVVGMALWNTTPADWTRAYRAVEAGLANGSLAPIVGQELPFAEAKRAHELVLQSGARGKIVLRPE